MLKAKAPIELVNSRAELDQLFTLENDFESKSETKEIRDELKANQEHFREVHGEIINSYFDVHGHPNKFNLGDFITKAKSPKPEVAITFRITMAGLVLGLSVLMSLIDMVYNKFMPNFGGVPMDIRVLDLLVIVIGMPIVGMWGSISVCIIEPWIHMAIDSDHTPAQIGFDCIAYSLTVILFFTIYYLAFKNSPTHIEANKKKRLFKQIVPAFVIIPVLAVVFTFFFSLALYVNYKSFGEASTWTKFIKNAYWVVWAELGVQALRFIIMYVLFILLEPTMKPINHRYR